MFSNPLTLVGLLAAGYLVLRSKPATTNTSAVPNPAYTPPIVGNAATAPPQPNYLEQAGKVLDSAGNVISQGKDLYGQLFPPTTVPTVPTTTPSALQTGTGGVQVDRFGIPHIGGQESIDRANRSDDGVGQTYRQLSDMYRLYFEDIEALVNYDMQISNNAWRQVYEWYRANPAALGPMMERYNQEFPHAPIVARG